MLSCVSFKSHYSLIEQKNQSYNIINANNIDRAQKLYSTDIKVSGTYKSLHEAIYKEVCIS